MNNDPSQITISTQKKPYTKHSQFTTSITFIWYGPEVPQDYMIRLSSLPYPVQFFKNPLITRSFNRQLKLIQKADYYRLQYIYDNGGIYSDFDNQIDYKCMGEVLAEYEQSQKVIFWWQPKRNFQTRKVVPNSFIYAPKPKMQAMKKILQNVNQSQRDLKFAGMQYLSQFANKQLIQVKQLYNCIQHEYDFSWIRQSGNTSEQRRDKQQLVNKKRKKAQIMSELQKVKKQNEQLKREYDILMEKYKETEEKLLKEYKTHYVQEERIKEEKEEVGNNKMRDQVIMNNQITQEQVIKNTQAASITDSKSINDKQVSSSTKNLQPAATTITQKQTARINKQQQNTLKQAFQSQPIYTRGAINTPTSNPYQPPAESYPPVYSGQGIKFVDTQQQVKKLHISGQIPPYKMDDTIMLMFVFVVIALVLVLILGFIWSKFKKYRKYAQVEFQLERKIESERKLRIIQKNLKEKQNQCPLSSQRSINEENQALRVRQ